MKFNLAYLILLLTLLVSCTGRTIFLQNHEGQIAKCVFGTGETLLTGIGSRDMMVDQ